MKLPFGFELKRSAVTAASNGPRWQPWTTLAAPVTQAAQAAPLTANRTNWAVLNTPIAAALTETYVSALIPDAPSVASGNKRTDDDFAEFLANCLTDLRLLVRSQFTNGEGLGFIRMDVNDKVQLVVLNPAQLDRSRSDAKGTYEGVVTADHRPVSYWILRDQPDVPNANVRPSILVPGADIVHIFERIIPGQVRGLSPLAPVMGRINSVQQLQDALIARVQVSSLFAGFVEDVNGTGAPDPSASLDMAPGSLRVLPPGTKISFPTVPDAGAAIDTLVAMIRDICAGVQLPYALVTGDLSRVNYSSGKMGQIAHQQRVKLLRATMVSPVIERLYARWASVRRLTGTRTPQRVQISWPQMPSLEPYKEASADIALINAGIRSRAEVIAARGRDVADVDREIQADTFVPKSAAVTNQNPTKETQQ